MLYVLCLGALCTRRVTLEYHLLIFSAAINLNSEYVKAYYRKALALKDLGGLYMDAARSVAERGLSFAKGPEVNIMCIYIHTPMQHGHTEALHSFCYLINC